MKRTTRLHSQPGARRLAVALALCAALLMCLGQAALAQTVTIEGFTFTVPDAFEKVFTESSVFKYTIDNDPEHHDLTVGIGHCGGGEKDLGLTLDWIYEQLEKGDGEYMQNLIHGQPTLFLQAVNEEVGVSYALVGITMNDAYLIGFERQTETTQPIGDILLDVLSSAQTYYPQIMKGVASVTPEPTVESTTEPTEEPTPEPTATPAPQPAASGDLLQVYTPEECATWRYNQTRLNYLGNPDERKASDDFLFCDLPWDTDLDTALRIIAANTDRVMEHVESDSYMGLGYDSPFWGLNEEECFLTLITVVPEETGWWVECQLTPKQVEFADDQDAAKFFAKLWRALDEYKHAPASYTLVVDDEALSVMDPGELTDMWADAVRSGHESARAYVEFNNLSLSMEKDLYGDTYYMTCWLTLRPGAR